MRPPIASTATLPGSPSLQRSSNARAMSTPDARAMSTRIALAVVSIATLAWSPSEIRAQHEHGRSPYAEMAIDEATSLPSEEVARLGAGEGMGMALPAEINGYPGPAHTLEMADRLELGPGQRSSLEDVRRRMTEAAVAKGAEILAAEAELTELFKSERAGRTELETLSLVVGRLRAELRAIHLAAHVETRALLSEEQILLYRKHRGYGPE